MPRTGTACLLAITAALAGCGGGGGGGGGKSVTLKQGQPLRLTASEYKFDPGNVTLDAGAKTASVTLQLHNSGALAHDVHVKRDGDDLGGTDVITNGKDATKTLQLPPGSYTLFCSVGDHEQLGMKGALVVQ